MAEVVLRLQQGAFAKELRFDRRDLLVGAAADCDVVLPLPGIAPRHLRVVVDAGVTRVRTLTDTAAALLSDRLLTSDEWCVMTDADALHLPIPGEPPVSIAVQARSSVPGGTVVEDDTPAEQPAFVATTAPNVATLDGITRTGGPLFAARAAKPAAKPTVRGRRWTQERAAVLLGSLVLAVVFAGVVAEVFRQTVRQHAAARVADAVHRADEQISTAVAQLAAGQYAAAKQSLDDARMTAESVGQGDAVAPRIAHVADRPEIRYGANGYALLDGQWQPSAVVAAELSLRDRDRPTLDKLRAAATAALAGNDLQNARRYGDDALEVLSRHAFPPATEVAAFAALRDEVQARLVTADMLAKGMVRVGDRWVTPDEKFRLDQQAAGLVEYRGRWMPKDEAFVATQKDKGLTLRDGVWMTADEIRAADGFVRFEDHWVLKAERDAVLAERAEKARVAEAQRQAERQKLIDQSNGRVAEADRLDKLKTDAYLASQNFLRQKLRVPARARFKPFGDPDVEVVASAGWFLVRAPVKAVNKQNVLVDAVYACKLRQQPDGQWFAENTAIVDDP